MLCPQMTASPVRLITCLALASAKASDPRLFLLFNNTFSALPAPACSRV